MAEDLFLKDLPYASPDQEEKEDHPLGQVVQKKLRKAQAQKEKTIYNKKILFYCNS